MKFLVGINEIKSDDVYDDVAKFGSEKITDALEEFVAELNKKLKKSAITTMLAGPELFFEMNRKIWHKKLVRKGIKNDEGVKGGREPATDEDIQSMLDVTKTVRDKAIIHFLSSTGSRPAGITDPILRMKHLVKMPSNCYAVKIYDESNEGYWSFLTPEARKALDKYFNWRKMIRREEFNEETPIFANFSKNAKNPHMSEMTMRKIVERIIKKSAIKRIKNGSKYDKATFIMFRKRFNGKLKMENQVNSNIAEKLMAHKRGLDGTYLQPTKEECFEEFGKAIHVLTIDPTERQKQIIDQKEKKITELSKKDDKIQELARKLEEYQKRDLDDKEIVRIVEQMEKTRPELTRVIESTFTESYKKIKIAINEDMKREFGLTDKDLEELEVEKERILKKIKQREKNEKLLKNQTIVNNPI